MFIKDKLVLISSDNYAVVIYVCYDYVTKDLNIFLVNKETSSKSIDLSITSCNIYKTDEVWQFKGNDERDTNPTLGTIDNVSIVDNQIMNYTLPSTSITVLKLTKVITH